MNNGDNENIQEQEAYKLILAQIIMALKIQAKGGNFICKIYESFTNITSKLICVLSAFYNNVYITKPLMSRASNSEKYIICTGFIDSKEKDKNINKLDNILVKMNKNKNIVDIFPDFVLPTELKTTLIKLNTEVSNKQFVNINDMVNFIKKQNYRGDEYVLRRQMQIDASKYWLDKFFPDTKDFETKKNDVIKETNNIINQNIKNLEILQKKLEF